MAHEVQLPFWTAISTYFAYGMLIFFGYIRDFYRVFRPKARYNQQGYAPIVRDFEDFYTRRLYHRIQDCWNRPITSCPGAWIDVVDRRAKYLGDPPKPTGKIIKALNVGSYNYLGFGDPDSPTKNDVFKAIQKYGAAMCSPRNAAGTSKLHRELEQVVARFLGKEDSICIGMGFGTNASGIPSLVGKGGLIISDTMNHSSIVVGARSSGASVRVFKHNDVEDLEAVIRRAIIEGQPGRNRPWTKILIMVEGIYSMEGEVPPLREIVALKKKYKCYLYVDEAHSIGALGRTGRGVCEHTGVDTADVDILMGTFTKAFGSVGGYLAGDKDLIQYIRQVCYATQCSAPLSPPAVQQAISAFKIILGEDGTDIGVTKLRNLRGNANYFRLRLKQMGAPVLGDWDSPICPVLLYIPGIIAAFSRKALAQGLAVVVVGYPASALLLGRSRFCISAAHTKADLDKALAIIEKILRPFGSLGKPVKNVPVPAGLLLAS